MQQLAYPLAGLLAMIGHDMNAHLVHASLAAVCFNGSWYQSGFVSLYFLVPWRPLGFNPIIYKQMYKGIISRSASGSAGTVLVIACVSGCLQSMCAEYVAGRKECVRLAMSHAAAFGFKDEVLHDAVLLVDRTMSSGTALPPTVLPLLVAACILISARQGARPLLFLMMLLLAVVLYCLYRGGFLTVSREH